LLIDSHAHLDSHRYHGDREAMLRRAQEAGVEAVLSIGIGEGPAEMHQARDLCRQFNGQPGMPRLYASAGIVGAALYLVLERVGAPRDAAALTGMAAIAGVRFAAIIWRLELPVLSLEEEEDTQVPPRR